MIENQTQCSAVNHARNTKCQNLGYSTYLIMQEVTLQCCPYILISTVVVTLYINQLLYSADVYVYFYYLLTYDTLLVSS
jgi:hypothetical protein